MEQTQPKLNARVSPLALLALVGLAAWNLWIYRPASAAVTPLPYSDFLAQVEAGNVAGVTITGSLIEGMLLQPLATEAGAQRSARRGGLAFRTLFPQALGDAGLIERLEAHHVQVQAAPALNAWLTREGAGWLPPALLLIVLGWAGVQAAGLPARKQNDSGDLPVTIERPQVTFADAAGADEAIAALQPAVDVLRDGQAKDPPVARSYRILLAGPQGAGKALLARAAAGEAGAALLGIDARELAEQPDAARAARQLGDVFARAQAAAPAVILLEHVEALSEDALALAALLVEMRRLARLDGAAIVLLAACGRPQALDPALLRPGLFDRIIGVSLPDRKAREGILRIHTRSMALAADVNLGRLARTTTGFSGADLLALCREAAGAAASKQHAAAGMDDFEDALDRILLGATRAVLLDDHERRTAAYHAAGHALTAWLTPEAVTPQRWSILPQPQLPEVEADERSAGRSTLLARIAVLLGGRAAEEIALGELSTLAEPDLALANRLARRMVARWSMGSLGLLVEAETGLADERSETTAARIDEDVQRLLAECYQADCQLLAAARCQLDALAQALMQDESLGPEDVARILGPRVAG